MKNLKFLAYFFAIALAFVSCEKETFDNAPLNDENTEIATTRSSGISEILNIVSSIDELRDLGIRVRNGLENRVDGDLNELISAATLAKAGGRANRNALRAQGFTNRQIRQLRRLFNNIQDFLDMTDPNDDTGNDTGNDNDPNTDTDTDPGSDPQLTQAQQDFVDRFSIPQDVLDELIARNSLDRIIEREQTQLSNPANIVPLGDDLFEVSVGINQGTETTRVTRTRAQMEATFSFQYLFSSGFDTRLQTPNTAATFDRMGREVFQALLDSL